MACFCTPKHRCGECCDSGYVPTLLEEEPYGDTYVWIAKDYGFCTCQAGISAQAAEEALVAQAQQEFSRGATGKAERGYYDEIPF